MTGFSAAAVLAAAPIRNDNNPIPEDRLSANGRRAKAASVIFVFLTALMLFKHMYIYAFCFGFGQAAAGAFLLWEKITKFEGRKTL